LTTWSGLVDQVLGIKAEVRIARVCRHRQVEVNATQVDHLRSDDRDRIVLIVKRHESVEQHPTRNNVEGLAVSNALRNLRHSSVLG
jgi:hypothetical protein